MAFVSCCGAPASRSSRSSRWRSGSARTRRSSASRRGAAEPLPYTDPDRLVIVNENNLSRGWTADCVAGELPRLEGAEPVVCVDRGILEPGAELHGVGHAGTAAGLAGTAGFYEMLDAKPVAGRLFRPEESRAGQEPGRAARSRRLAARVRCQSRRGRSDDRAERPVVHHRRCHARRLAVRRPRAGDCSRPTHFPRTKRRRAAGTTSTCWAG